MKTISVIIANLFIAVSLFAQGSVDNGKAVYESYCRGCHGAQLEGAAATALIKTNWKHGGDRMSIINTIANGVPTTEMAKWSGILSKDDIAAVADFIIASQTKPVEKRIEKPLSIQTKDYKLKIEKVVTGDLGTPWGVEFVDTTHALISQRVGKLTWMIDGKLDPVAIAGLPNTYAQELTGGYMDIALDPLYATNGWIYLAYAQNPSNSNDPKTPGMTKVVRGKIKDHQWIDQQTLFEVNDSLKLSEGVRWGARFLFDKQGHLFFSIGDMGRGKDSQILTRPSGKIFRINTDGSIPKDNPLYGQPKVLQAIYSWGNRNVQGIAQHPVTGTIYASEHGPKGGDELNIIKKGGNYGWPVITYGIDYDGSIISNDTKKDGMEQPITTWTPSIAVSAIDFVTSSKFPKWKNNLIISALGFEEIRRLTIDKDKVTDQELLLKGYGRVRDVKFGPDGCLYVLTNAPDAILRIIPE
jgi:glucose/arabinose dehydrogenase